MSKAMSLWSSRGKKCLSNQSRRQSEKNGLPRHQFPMQMLAWLTSRWSSQCLSRPTRTLFSRKITSSKRLQGARRNQYRNGSQHLMDGRQLKLHAFNRAQGPNLALPAIQMRPPLRLRSSPDRDCVRSSPKEQIISIRKRTNGTAHQLHEMSLMSSKNSLRGYALALPYTSHGFPTTAAYANGLMQRETILRRLRTPS